MSDDVGRSPLRSHMGPTDADPDPGKEWCYDCGSEVWNLKEGRICTGCKRGELYEDPAHLIAGRMTGASGVVTFCTCGLAFFAAFEGSVKNHETDEQRQDAMTRADVRWDEHRP